MLDAKTTLNYDDELELTFGMQIHAMEGDSIATAINTYFFLKVDSSSCADGTMREDSNEEPEWERLESVEIPSNTWEYVVSHTSSSRKRSKPDTSDDNTTTSRQGEG